MSWVAAAVVGTAVVGGVVQDQGAKRAAASQRSAANAANATQQSQFEMQREDAEPWRQAGMNALKSMDNPDFRKDFTMGDFQTDPGYQFRMNEANKAIERSAAARGGLNSGRTMKELTRYSQDVASDEYQNAYNRFNADRDRRFNRLSSIAGTGQTANAQVASAGQNMANNISANQLAVGNANAASNMATANAFNNTASTGMNTWMQYQMMNRFAPKTGG